LLIIFTDLDGTLLDQEDYSYKPALPMLEKLKQQKIPVVPVTSKTRVEVEDLRQVVGLTDPFIVENGSAVFLPSETNETDRPFLANTEPWGDYHLLRLGCTYAEARTGLQAVSQQLGESLRGFGDLTAAEVQDLTGLPLDAVQRAQTREFTEPFVTPKSSSENLEAIAHSFGFRVLVGDRFSHLIGGNAGKGAAVKKLQQYYQQCAQQTAAADSVEKMITVGLGNSPNDLEMLEAVDIPIVIPARKGPHPGLADRGWQIAPEHGPTGWAMMVQEICDRFSIPLTR
jgi:mannosyl-3-phosphoglycerate phosphatase